MHDYQYALTDGQGDDERTPEKIALDFKKTMSELRDEMTIYERKAITRILNETLEIVE